MYARIRERKLKKCWIKPKVKRPPGPGVDHTKYVLKSLEEIDNGKDQYLHYAQV